VCFTSKQTLYSILSGARLLVSNSVSSAPIICLGSCAIALGPIWPRILCHLIAVAPISLRAFSLAKIFLLRRSIELLSLGYF